MKIMAVHKRSEFTIDHPTTYSYNTLSFSYTGNDEVKIMVSTSPSNGNPNPKKVMDNLIFHKEDLVEFAKAILRTMDK